MGRFTRVFSASDLLAILMASSSSAAVVNADGDPLTPPLHPGAVLDTTTGLLWLDSYEGIFRSYNDVSNKLDPGGEFAGYRYATLAELGVLWKDFGLTDVSGGLIGTANTTAMQGLLSIWGHTHLDRRGSDEYAHVLTADRPLGSTTTHLSGAVGIYYEDFGLGFGPFAVLPETGNWNDDFANSNQSSALVRSVPESSSIALAAFGLVALAAYRLRRRK